MVGLAAGTRTLGQPGCWLAVECRRHRLPYPCGAGGGGGTAARPERRVGAVSATAAGRAGRHKSRFVTAASALGPPVWRACPGPGGLRGVPRPLCLAQRERPAWEAGDVARGGARAARVTAEPDTGRARRRGRHQTRARRGVGGAAGEADNGLGREVSGLGGRRGTGAWCSHPCAPRPGPAPQTKWPRRPRLTEGAARTRDCGADRGRRGRAPARTAACAELRPSGAFRELRPWRGLERGSAR